MNLVQKIKTELGELGIKPQKGLGQNFLVNEGIYRKIIDAVETGRGETIIEIGPGLGTLTEYLSETGANIIAIEKDRYLVKYLQKKFANQKNVRIVEYDILKFQPANYKLETGNYKLVGNIPYYITSHLLKIIFEKWPRPKSIVLMIQKEVAQRIVAKPPQMSLLAVSVRYYAEPKIISYVSKGSFYPAPKVDSAVVKLVPYSVTDSASFQKRFFEIVKIGFAGKRKQLANNFSSGLKLPRNETDAKLLSLGVDPKRRAETLSIEEWRKITKIFF